MSRHGGGPQKLSELRRLLTEVRRKGAAGEDGEVTPGFASIAAAVHDHAARPVAAVAVTYPTEDRPDGDEVARSVVHAAAELTRRISGRRPERV